jgi:hypothetical protein
MLTQILKSKRTWFVLLPFFVSVGRYLWAVQQGCNDWRQSGLFCVRRLWKMR